MGRLKKLLAQKQILVLHGPLGTELEAMGYDVSGKLWSAKYLLEKPEVIQELHEIYLNNGSNILTTSTYQATIPGLEAAGLNPEQAADIIRLTVQLAHQARDNYWQNLSDEQKTQTIYPLISGDVGPYAAYLADGSEYNGQYGKVSLQELKDFHRPRIQLFLEQEVDMLALETIPNRLEVQALTELLSEEFPQIEVYMSFTAQETGKISDGTSLKDVIALVEACPQILAVGFNCTQPRLYDELLQELRTLTTKPLVTYPNSGEIYDGATQTWHHSHEGEGSLVEQSLHWIHLGAQIVGGCCRTRPAEIAALAQAVRKQNK
ncbi:homocysteine S-methyltransferase [Enterococcus cecorum]|uniref:homocysteine S-methyltransferase n=1 Tax=Enterococcus cecorum TaxID=44008 RepID=UPI00064297F5|nr:homocysteine S-methyltransferase [Enterococcus cecorum]KLO70850.1 homocysteine methyltransferase [Enterococcus cecorum]CAI3355218.1 homocysteine S-methyltransferase [Enterococcus cecorum]